MPRITETIDVAMPAEAVFDYLANFQNTAEWDPGIARSERLDDGPLGVGSRFHLEANLGFTTAPLVYEVTTFEAPTAVTLATRSRRVEGEDRIRVEPVDETSSRVTWDARFGLTGAVGAVLDPLLVPGFKLVGRRAVSGLEERLRELATA